MVESIQCGTAEFLYKESNRISLFKVFCKKADKFVKVVYDKDRKEIVTVLKEMKNV